MMKARNNHARLIGTIGTSHNICYVSQNCSLVFAVWIADYDRHGKGELMNPDTPARSTDAMAVILHAVVNLEPKTRLIVMYRLADPCKPIPEIAKSARLPVPHVHDRLKEARREWPALAYAMPAPMEEVPA
jgi:hypothetical protein